MHIDTVWKNTIEIAVIRSSEVILKDVQTALDLMAAVRYDTGCDRMVLHKSSICEEFFDLRTKLAGEILQKFINYHMKIAIVGDFTIYSSSSLKDFLYESNQGNDIFFLLDEEQALQKLSVV